MNYCGENERGGLYLKASKLFIFLKYPSNELFFGSWRGLTVNFIKNDPYIPKKPFFAVVGGILIIFQKKYSKYHHTTTINGFFQGHKGHFWWNYHLNLSNCQKMASLRGILGKQKVGRLINRALLFHFHHNNSSTQFLLILSFLGLASSK